LEWSREQNFELVGRGGLLGQLTKDALETALDVELVERLGYEEHNRAGRSGGSSRSGVRAEMVLRRSARSRSSVA
jgi:transposase-like protein